MSDQDRRNPIPTLLTLLVLVGGGWYFFQNFEIDGLDHVSVSKKETIENDLFVSYADRPAFGRVGSPSSTDSNRFPSTPEASTLASQNPFRNPVGPIRSPIAPGGSNKTARRVPHLRIGSWAIDGPVLQSSPDRRDAHSLVLRILSQFDLIALQQTSALEHDAIPTLVDGLNEGAQAGRYDYVLGPPDGPPHAQERLAFVFDTQRIRVDRSQTYSIADPAHQMTYDPLVAWFQAGEPEAEVAWTFSLVNVRVDLAQAPLEVALLPAILKAVRYDGRGEDDVVMAGLLQADDAYLLPGTFSNDVRPAIRSTTTDVMGQHQTSNLLVDFDPTNEFLGRGGVLDFLRIYNLSLDEAKVISTQLPIFAEFSAYEGGLRRD